MYLSLYSIVNIFKIDGRFSKIPSETSAISYSKWKRTGIKSSSVILGPRILAHS
jgi:hypothetical protein